MPPTAAIFAPLPGRDAYPSAVVEGVASARVAEASFRASPVDGIPAAGPRADTARAATRRPDDSQSRADSEPGLAYSGLKGTIPFLVQRLAQEGTATLQDDSESNGEIPLPSVRFAATAAYGATRDSTVEYLSPTPIFDIQV